MSKRWGASAAPGARPFMKTEQDYDRQAALAKLPLAGMIAVWIVAMFAIALVLRALGVWSPESP